MIYKQVKLEPSVLIIWFECISCWMGDKTPTYNALHTSAKWCMIESQELPHFLAWRSYMCFLCACAPFKAWHDQNPSVDHLHVFGCLEHALLPEKQRKKLDGSWKMHFGGYIFESKGYHLCHPQTRQTLISNDVLWKMQFTPAFTYWGVI